MASDNCLVLMMRWKMEVVGKLQTRGCFISRSADESWVLAPLEACARSPVPYRFYYLPTYLTYLLCTTHIPYASEHTPAGAHVHTNKVLSNVLNHTPCLPKGRLFDRPSRAKSCSCASYLASKAERSILLRMSRSLIRQWSGGAFLHRPNR